MSYLILVRHGQSIWNLEKEIQEHIDFIEKEIKISVKESRMQELKNWLDYLKAA